MYFNEKHVKLSIKLNYLLNRHESKIMSIKLELEDKINKINLEIDSLFQKPKLLNDKILKLKNIIV